MLEEKITADFYDRFWPSNLPSLSATKRYINSLLPKEKYFRKGLDAGCGAGVTSLVLSDKCNQLWAVDISRKSLAVAARFAKRNKKNNIDFQVASILNLPFKDKWFDLVFCWGVVHHTQNPKLALSELVRVLKPAGTLIIAVYRKTLLAPLHELIRKLAVNTPARLQPVLLSFLTFLVEIVIVVSRRAKTKRTGMQIKALVKDWYFVPEKHFFSKEELEIILKQHHLRFKVTEEYSGRFRSSSNIVIVGQKTE